MKALEKFDNIDVYIEDVLSENRTVHKRLPKL